MSINFNELRELLGAISQTDITELILKSEEFELTVRKGALTIPVVPTVTVNPPEVVGPPPSPSTVPPVSIPEKVESVSEEPASTKIDRNWVTITSPMVGTFYRSPAPDEPPFVEIGDRIRVGQTVCILEAMKLMNEIEAEVAGEIVEIGVSNGEPVEYGQVLMRIKPD